MKNPTYLTIIWGFISLMILFVESLAFPFLMNMANDFCIPSAIASIIVALVLFGKTIDKTVKYAKKI